MSHDLTTLAGRGRPHPSDRAGGRPDDIRKENGAMYASTASSARSTNGSRARGRRAKRIVAERRAARVRHERAEDRRIRRAIGRSIVRFGERIAAEQGRDGRLEHLSPAESR